MNSSQIRRTWIIIIGLCFFTVIIVGRLFAFQVVQGNAWVEQGRRAEIVQVRDDPERGIIYDRNGAVLAANAADYQISAAPNLVQDAGEVATTLAPIMEEPRNRIQAELESAQSFVMLAPRVGADIADAVRVHDFDGIQIDPLPRRIYPQGSLLSHVLGYVDFDNQGGSGLEGQYQRVLAGEAASASVNISPLTFQPNVIAREGADLVLTIDRTVQYAVEQALSDALIEHQARSGTIIVMDPRTGAILAMASKPDYTPYDFYKHDAGLLLNPAISRMYEPGSVMKLITMAAALDSGTVTPQSTYYDSGVIEMGGSQMYNWDRSAPGLTDMTTLLSRSLNVGAATLASWMGPDVFYHYMEKFNFGRPTGIDLMAEAIGIMPLPGDENWTEASLGTNAFGQGLAVTPLQMIVAASALANDGKLMQPYVVQEIHAQGQVLRHEPTVLSQAVSKETARQLTAMAVNAVASEVYEAQVDGYTIAGKTGTAQIAEGGIYLLNDVIGSFIGWLPADNPEIIVLVKLDRPQLNPWGSQTAAPTFASLAQELVVLLDIPPDRVRLQADIMAARGGN
ncbi:MAG: penicillin-binding protein 2 [Anaerolineales bacterium]|nr:penicillin-binding protein 2 [Anaerolineales bacterium]MCB8952336.1 penicillin-binding protein 2 [Ardenticatenales bacterium]